MGSPYHRMGPTDWRSAEPVDDGDHVAWVQNINAAITSGVIGEIDDVAYADPTGADDGTVISLLKGCYVQLAAINTNTAGP